MTVADEYNAVMTIVSYELVPTGDDDLDRAIEEHHLEPMPALVNRMSETREASVLGALGRYVFHARVVYAGQIKPDDRALVQVGAEEPMTCKVLRAGNNGEHQTVVLERLGA